MHMKITSINYCMTCFVFQRAGDLWSEMAREVRANFNSNGVRTRTNGRATATGRSAVNSCANSHHVSATNPALALGATCSTAADDDASSGVAEGSSGGDSSGGFLSSPQLRLRHQLTQMQPTQLQQPASVSLPKTPTPSAGFSASFRGDPYGPMSATFGNPPPQQQQQQLQPSAASAVDLSYPSCSYHHHQQGAASNIP